MFPKTTKKFNNNLFFFYHIYIRQFVGSNITDDKYELIQLFYKYIAPLPQRKFRANRLGTLLSDSQKQSQGQKRSLSPDVE